VPLPEKDNSCRKAPADSARAEAFTRLSPQELTKLARRLRRHIVTMIGRAGSGHVGGSLSAVEIVASLYFHIMQHDPTNPCWPERDRFILSKGHAAPVLYAVLAECGYLSLNELGSLRQMGSRLQGHTDRSSCPGVEMSAGALGQGLSFAIGTALAGRLDSRGYTVYTLLGDGECDEGQVWEAAMSAAHFKVDNLVAIVDNNGLQIDGWNRDVMNLEPFADKWRAFGWHVIKCDGHDFGQLIAALEEAKKTTGKPAVIIAKTIKGKGVSFMENQADFHGVAPTTEQVKKALEELK